VCWCSTGIVLLLCLDVAVKGLSSVLPCLDISNNLPLVISIAGLQWGEHDTRSVRAREIEEGNKEGEKEKVVEGNESNTGGDGPE